MQGWEDELWQGGGQVIPQPGPCTRLPPEGNGKKKIKNKKMEWQVRDKGALPFRGQMLPSLL